MTEEIDPNKAIDFLYKNAEKYAESRAHRIYLEEFRKSRKALLMKSALSSGAAKTSAAAEMEAYASEEYIEFLSGLEEAVKKEEELRWALIAAQARIDVWRSMEASNRVVDKAVL